MRGEANSANWSLANVIDSRAGSELERIARGRASAQTTANPPHPVVLLQMPAAMLAPLLIPKTEQLEGNVNPAEIGKPAHA